MRRQSLKKVKLPETSGVYRFVGTGGKILYIGRATSLRSRVRSYFTSDVIEKRGPAISRMVEDAKTVKWETTDSVLESLILEANLIKKYQPKYNVKEKDDKSFNYIVITKEQFPRVFLVRGREVPTTKYQPRAIFGPFPRGGVLRDALKIIRKIFPFRDTCIPLQIHAPHLRYSNVLENIGIAKMCFNAQIGLCPGVCSGSIEKKDYRAIIKNLSLFLSGKKRALVQKLKRDMKAASKKKEFERASELKRTIFALQHIQDVALIKNADTFPHASASGQRSSAICRIEAYDVAHIRGTAMVGVMTVIENGEPEKNEYRKFKIKTVRGADDTASLAEILKRRFSHPEWSYPRLIVVDGGVAQKNRAKRVLKEMGMEIPVVSVVKDERHRPRAILGLDKVGSLGVARPDLEKSIIRANVESHRFALAYHKKTRAKHFLPRHHS